MSEPHELEERAITRFLDTLSNTHSNADAVRAVLDLVRQEQEKAASLSMIGAAYELDNAPGMLPTAADYYAAMIRAWWLSHTAPQEK